MATYKVIQDIEAEDKLLGPLTLRQFIFAIVAVLSFYFSYLLISHHAGFLSPVFILPGLFALFFAIPFGKDQPTEIWALAKIRFLFKPRRRIWDQSGVKDLVTITVPKKVEEIRTNGLSQNEVKSRLSALADTIDSRGWSIKNLNISTYSLPGSVPTNVDGSDRLIDMNGFPQEVYNSDIAASDDIMDAQNNPIAHQFDQMITASTVAHHQQLMDMMSHPAMPPARQNGAPAGPSGQASTGSQPQNYWFLNQPVEPPQLAQNQAVFSQSQAAVLGGVYGGQQGVIQAAEPTADEESLGERLKQEHDKPDNSSNSHLRNIAPPGTETHQPEKNMSTNIQSATKPYAAPPTNPAVLQLANNNDLNVATIARQAHKVNSEPLGDDEVIIALH